MEGEFLSVMRWLWTDLRDNKTYKIVTINGKTWLAENFAYLPYVQKQEGDEERRCSVYGVNDATQNTVETLKADANYTKYGVLYTANALSDVVPTGWRVATDQDWQELERLSGMEDAQVVQTGYRTRGETSHKFIKEGEPFEGSAKSPTDELKLSITYGGYYKPASYRGGFRGASEYTYFWTSTQGNQYTTSGNYYRAFSYKRVAVERNLQQANYRMYVRLVKED